MDEYRIESHKLLFHVDRVSQWLKGQLIYPIYIEIAPSGMCNHRCYFCALDYLGYSSSFIDKDILIKIFFEIARLGVKSIMFAGEGEPLLHRDIKDLVVSAHKAGIDVAITTNGVFLKKNLTERILPALKWIRVSLDAGKALTYSKIHRCHREDFTTVIKNISEAVRIKKKNRYLCTIGVQFLLLPENYREVTTLAKILKNIGVDYLIIKPYSQHPKSKNKLDIKFNYNDYFYLEDELKKISSRDFRIIFRSYTMQKLKEEKPYKGCPGISFWTYINSRGDVYACSTFLGDKRFCYGNIYKNSFRKIWESKRRKKILEIFSGKKITSQCRQACRLDEINRYLWSLKHPPLHVNFI